MGLSPPVAVAQQWGSLSGGRGTLSVDTPDLDLFVDSFNRASTGILSESFDRFNSAGGWNFDVGYETGIGGLGLAFGSGLHRYSTASEALFANGGRHELELTVQDLTGSWELLFYQRYLFIGPGFWISHRRVTLDSRETSPGSVLADEGLVGEYTGSNYELRWGGIAGVWWGPFRASVRVLGAGRVLGSDDRLFDGDLEHVETGSSYFPADYEAFSEGSARPRRNAAHADVRGRIVEFAVAVFFPL